MYSKEHRLEKQREAQRRYRERHAEELKAAAERVKGTEEQREIWREKTRQWRRQNPEANLRIQRKADLKRYHATKAAAFEKLGNTCVRCGFDDARVLQVDHIVAIGDTERRRLKHFGKNLWATILQDSAPFQLLCPTCNWIKRVENKEVRQPKSDSRITTSARSTDGAGTKE